MTKITRRAFAASSAAAAAVAGFGLKPASAQAYPARPVTVIVPWGAGGGTDATARIVAALLEKDLGQPFNVVNRTGGSGVVGHSAIANADPDGYTLGIMTIEIDMMHWQGLTDLTYADYDILALVNPTQRIRVLASSAKADVVNPLIPNIASETAQYEIALVSHASGATTVDIVPGAMTQLNPAGVPARDAFVRIEARFEYDSPVQAALGPFAYIDRVDLTILFNG